MLEVVQPRLFRNLTKDMYTETYRAPKSYEYSLVVWRVPRLDFHGVGGVRAKGGSGEGETKEKAQPRIKAI